MQAIEIQQNWYHGAAGVLVQGRTPLLHPGVYRIPEDISADLGRRAVAEGVAIDLAKPLSISNVASALEAIPARWRGATVIVAAPGPSLTAEVVERCKGHRTVAVQDAYRLMPFADVLYGCDAEWWRVHGGAAGFNGQKWSTHDDAHNDKRAVAADYGVHLVAGKAAEGFSLDPAVIHYGSSSGFQAVNLAILMGAAKIVLIGFDMRVADGRRHFFGDHPEPLNNKADFASFVPPFVRAAQSMPPGVEILNATPGSALQCLPMVDLDDVLPDAEPASPGRGPNRRVAAADRAGAAQTAPGNRLSRSRRADRAQPAGGDR
jgi:hypothetical protein